jgi:superfamily II DNA or RNA helicase
MNQKYFEQYELVIGDEAHGFKSKSLTSIMTKCVNAKYRIGTTGTLDGTQTHKLVLEGLFGKVFKVTSTKKLIDSKHLSPFTIKAILLRHPDSICHDLRKISYQEELEYLITSEARNNFIKNLVLDLKTNTLLLFRFVEKHGQLLYDMIKGESNDRKIFFVYGGVDSDTRERIRHIVESESDAIIVASYGVFSVGINIRNLHNIIFASPSKSRIRNLQSIGRGLRKSKNKDIATLYDIADDLSYGSHHNYTLDHFEERLKIYKEENFSMAKYKVQLKT